MYRDIFDLNLLQSALDLRQVCLQRGQWPDAHGEDNKRLTSGSCEHPWVVRAQTWTQWKSSEEIWKWLCTDIFHPTWWSFWSSAKKKLCLVSYSKRRVAVTAAKGASTKYWAKAVNTHVHVTIYFIFLHSYFGVSFVPGLMQIQAEHSNFIQKVFGGRWRTMFTCSMFSPCLRGFFPGYSERFKMTKICECLTVICVTDWQQIWQALGPRDLMYHSTYLLFVICLLFLM